MYKFLLLLHRNRYRSIDIVFLSFDDMKIVSMNLVAMKFTNISPYYLFFFIILYLRIIYTLRDVILDTEFRES